MIHGPKTVENHCSKPNKTAENTVLSAILS